MTEYVFTGRIHPDLGGTDVFMPHRQITVGDLGLVIDFRGSAANSDLLVWATPSVEVDVETLRNYVHEGVAMLLDAEGMRMGRAFTIEIRSVVLPTGEHRGFDTAVPGVANGPGAVPLSLDSIQQAMGRWPQLAYSLADLRYSLLDPANTPFFCRRAAESLTHHWPSSNGAARWSSLQTALRLEKAFLQPLGNSAGDVRHGKFGLITGSERLVQLRTAWIVVGRFIALLNSGQASLPSDEYALLTSLP